MPPVAPGNDSQAEDPSCTVANSSVHPVRTNIEHQSGTTLGTVQIDNNNCSIFGHSIQKYISFSQVHCNC